MKAKALYARCDSCASLVHTGVVLDVSRSSSITFRDNIAPCPVCGRQVRWGSDTALVRYLGFISVPLRWILK